MKFKVGFFKVYDYLIKLLSKKHTKKYKLEPKVSERKL